jgi:hypothetical protein
MKKYSSIIQPQPISIHTFTTIQMERQDNSAFSINGFFNNLPIRIIGSPEEPFFYASDIAAILGIQKISYYLKGFDETEIVTPEKRLQHGLITYKLYKKGPRRDDRIILLTEHGVYRFVINSRSELARPFKLHIYELIRQSRISEKEKLIAISNENITHLQEINMKMNKDYKDYQKYNPAIYVFRKKIDTSPYNHILVDERDDYFENDENLDESARFLYKYTTHPRPEDYTAYDPYAKLFGNSREMMDELGGESINTTAKAAEYCVYKTSDDMEEVSTCEALVLI